MKVFIVLSNNFCENHECSCSSDSIDGIFLTREAAVEYIRKFHPAFETGKKGRFSWDSVFSIDEHEVTEK